MGDSPSKTHRIITSDDFSKLKKLVRRAGFDRREEVGHYGDMVEHARQSVADVRRAYPVEIAKWEMGAASRLFQAMIAEDWPKHATLPTVEDGFTWCLNRVATDLEYALQCTSAMFWHVPKPDWKSY